VLTLHNYRLFCPAAIPMRAGAVCTECIDQRSVLPALRHGCYRGSRVATLPLAASVSLHRRLGTWQNDVDAFISLSGFQKDRMVAAGLPPALVHVKPNFLPGTPSPVAWAERGAHLIFAGRLTPEKGAMTLLAAWKAWGADAPPLTIVGDGPQRAELEEFARAAVPGKVRFLGQLARDATLREIARARMLIVPSECFEGLPTVLIEAFAFGTPVAVSNLGPLASLVQAGVNGVLFVPKSPPSLLESVRAAWQAPRALESLGAGAKETFDTTYAEEANYAALLDIYAAAIEVSGKRRAEQGNERQAS
jgi:glycosyltransferase involved in cell wall biosynthesis